MAGYLHLNMESELLDSLASEYHLMAERAVDDLLASLRAMAVRPETDMEADQRIQCQDWLFVILSSLLELRSSLVYAEAHYGQHMKQSAHSAMIPTESSQAFDYFMENATLRVYSVIEKTLQLLNVFCGLGLAEAKKVQRWNVRAALDDPEYVGALDRLYDSVEPIGEMRHAHVHRFDPGTPRTAVVGVAVEGGDPLHIVKLYQLRERPVSASDQLLRCKQTYRGLDNELAALFRDMSGKIR
jgi:hypothetical protein